MDSSRIVKGSLEDKNSVTLVSLETGMTDFTKDILKSWTPLNLCTLLLKNV